MTPDLTDAENWGEICRAFLGSALGVTVVGGILSLWVGRRLEELKVALAKSTLEHSVRFTKVYERRFEVAEEVWAALVKADRALGLPGNPMWTGEENFREDWKHFAEAAEELRETLNHLIIHFSDDGAGRFEAYWQAMKDAGFAARDRGKEDVRSGWWERYENARARMEELKPVLKRECQTLLTGVEPLKA